MKSVKKVWLLVSVVLILSFTGCFNNEEKKDNAVGVKLERTNSGVVVRSAQAGLGQEIIVGTVLSESNIEFPNGRVGVVTQQEGKTVVAITKKGNNINVDEELFRIKNTPAQLDVSLSKNVTEKDLSNTKNIKKAGSAATPVLLGDCNGDGVVSLLDIPIFKVAYGTSKGTVGYDAKCDIAPATMVTAQNPADNWSNIYNVSTPDDKVNIIDFVVMAMNFGKKPVLNTDQADIDTALAAITNTTIKGTNTDLLSVTTDLTLSTTAVNGVTFSWATSDAATVTTLGKVTQASTDKSVKLTLTATKNSIAATKTFDVTVKAIVVQNGITIYIEKPTDWAEIWMWYDSDLTTPAWDTLVLKTAPGDMVSYRTGWYKKEFPSTVKTVSFLFNDGTWGKKFDTTGVTTAVSTTNFVNIAKTTWITKDGKTLDKDPVGPQAPSITISPQGGYFATTQTVKITVSYDTATTAVGAKYTIDGSDPKTNGIAITNSVDVTIGSDMADGAAKDVKVWAGSTVTATSESLEAISSATFTKGTPPKPKGLGAGYSAQGTTFSIWSPDTSNVVVNVDGKDYNCSKLADTDGYTNVYGVTVAGDLHLKEYQFKINGNAVRDPNGVMVNNNNGKNVVINMAATDPDGGWAARPALIAREDSIIYEVHVRDFSIADNSGVDADKKGKYLGMVQTGTVSGGAKTGIDHLKELGVTHVQILPFFDFAGSVGSYNWGYDPINFNIPEERYASNPSDYITRIKEVKTMINEFHKNGIRVIMDVVYNHTSDPAGSEFSGITQKYYYPLGDPRNGMSGCGRALNSSEPMTSRFIQDSLNFWVSEYKMDGYRFDLIGDFIYTEVNKWGESLNKNNPNENLLIYGEPWDGYYDNGDAKNTDSERGNRFRYGKLPALAANHIGAFNNKIRDGIRGEGDYVGADKYRAYMHNVDATNKAGLLKTAMTGSLIDSKSTSNLSDAWAFPFTYDPEQTINYVSAHDNLCLWDKIIMEGFSGDRAKKMDKMANGMVLTAQGIPFIHAGDEILRTKGSDIAIAKNSYDKGDGPNKIDWSWKSSNIDVFNFYKDIIAMRKMHAGFRMTDWDKVKANVSSSTAGSAVITKINGAAVGDTWKNIIVVSNPDPSAPYSLPLTGMWKIFAEKGSSNVTGTASGSISCEGPNVTILYQE